MTRVTLDQRGLRVNGGELPLISGEFNFWRHNPEHWRPILREMREIGCRVVSTFVCWDFHERDRSKFVFDASESPLRDLQGFVRAAGDEGLSVILRTGPIIDSEWPTRGPAPDVAAMERSHPQFRARAAGWTDAVMAAVRDQQASKDGPIVAFQIDNEVFYPHCTEASATEADSAFHIPYDERLVLGDLDRWYQEQGKGREPLPHGTVPLNTLSADQQLVAFDFLRDQVVGYLSWVQDRMSAAGIDVPCYSNIKQFCAYQDLRVAASSLPGGVGGNNYLDRLEHGEDFANAAWWNGVQRATTPFHWAPELWCGRWIEMDQDTAVFQPDHYRFCLLTQLALGVRGCNYFMLVERDDWHYSPITGIGRVRAPLAQAVADVNRVLAGIGTDQRVANVAITWSVEDHQQQLANRDWDWTQLSSIWWEQGQPKERDAWWRSFRALLDADLDVSLVRWDDPKLADYEVVVVPDGGRTPRYSPSIVVTADPRDLVAEVEKAGGRRPITTDDRRLWTSLYRRADGQMYGFCVNPTRNQIRTRIKSPLVPPGQLSWTVEPAAHGDDYIEMSPRAVAVFVVANGGPGDSRGF